MRATHTLLDEKARKAVRDGVNAIYEPVRRTFGPQGKNALLYRTWGRGPRITNDGYTVAECQEPKDIFIRLAAQVFKESCKRTNEKVGDGTTGTAIIGGKLFNEAYSLLSENSSSLTAKDTSKIGVMTLRKNILESAERVKQAIKDSAKKVESLEDLEKIAIISVEDPELGKVIAKMAFEVGVDGFIDTVEGYKGGVETEIIRGMRFPAKVAAKAFVNNPNRYEMIAEDCSVFITNHAFDNIADIKFLKKLNGDGISKIIIIAPSFSENVLINMLNASKGNYLIFPVKVPSLRTEQFEDIATYSGATFFDKTKGKNLSHVQVGDLGFLEKLIVKETESKEDAVATGGRGTQNQLQAEKISNAVADRIEVLKGQLVETKQEQYKILLQRRIASMASAVGVIRVGDSTQASALYRKLKIEDGVYACKAALRGGYVKGGGLCLKEIADTLPDDDILKSTLIEPYNQIQASVDGGIVIGPDIIDPAEAIYYAVEHAVGVVAHLITVDMITPEAEDMVTGEGDVLIARALGEVSIALKRHFGQLKENEEEMARDSLKGFTPEEVIDLDRGW